MIVSCYCLSAKSLHFFIIVSILVVTLGSVGISHVKVFHYILDYWGQSFHGDMACRQLKSVRCEWTYSDHIKHLKYNLIDTIHSSKSYLNGTVTVALYNIHSWWEKQRDHFPANCELHTNLTMAESEESSVRYGYLFDGAFKNFDGHSTTHPNSSVPRYYSSSLLNSSEFLPMKPFGSLLQGGSYVATDCHKRDGANANRDNIVQQLRNAGVRIDGLGKCMHWIGPGGSELIHSKNSEYNLFLKREAIAKYLFHYSFENCIEPGYVTEKGFDPLLSGVVPVYLGDAEHFKQLLPHPSAAIFVADFESIEKLAEYLKYLLTNETAYEYHRQWRKAFSSTNDIIDSLLSRRSTVPVSYLNGGEMQFYYSSYRDVKPSEYKDKLLVESWPCRVCAWAADTAAAAAHTMQHSAEIKRHKWKKCEDEPQTAAEFVKMMEGKPVRGNSRTIYLVQNGTLRMIPNIDTFVALKLDFANVAHIDDAGLKRFAVGEDMPIMDG